MRKYFLYLGMLKFVLLSNSFAQVIPNGATGPASKTPIKTSIPPDASLYFKRIFTPNMLTADSTQVNMSSAVEDVNTITQYVDGLSRPFETIVKQASPLKNDLVSASAFDAFGNASIQYQPYAAQTGNTNDGKAKINPFKDDSAFYHSLFPNEQVYYGQQFFDGSPLNRTVEQMAPGNSWAGSNKGIIDSERANNAADSVRVWSISISSENDIPTSTSAYQTGSLIVKILTDESGNKTISYTDELGRTVLTKTLSSSTPTSGHTGWLCTYYVYDEMNHLRMVIPPKASALLLSLNWDLADNSSIVDNLCYSYWYDSRARVTEKHIPNKGKSYIAYDLYDHPVMMQDANLSATNQWMFLKYDGQSRPDTSGLITVTGLSAAQVITNAAASKDYPSLIGTYTVLTVNFYDNYSWVSGSIPSNSLDATNINSTNFITNYNTSPSYAQQLTQSQRIRGFVTGTQKLVLGTSNYLYTVNIYDDRSRLIQSKQTNYTGGTDVATNQYDFSGKILRNHLQHQKFGHNTTSHTLLTKYGYDHVGRLTILKKNIDATTDKTIAQYTYNELGQLITKQLGNLESQNLTYNIRGWLNGINKTYVETATSTSNFFGEEVFYDFGFSSSYTNGRIAGVKWKSTGDDLQRAYGFGYDKANRLTTANFTQQNPGSTIWTCDKMDFSVSGLKYDANGNITGMNQQGVNVNTPINIDSLGYTYFANSNQLEKVTDYSTNSNDLGDFQDTTLSANDYAYDANGNIIKDLNKHIHTGGGSGITLNFLNKPSNINVNGMGSIAYTYDATGALLQKTITDNNLNTKTVITYIAGFVYQKVLPSSSDPANVSDTIQYALHDEGRIRWSFTQLHPSGIRVFDYFLRDHLGNVRSVVTDEQDTATYPLASLEPSGIASQKLYYSGLDSGIINKSTITGYPTDDTSYTNPNNYVQQLRGDGPKVGSGILLKVMAGDTINVHVSSWYKLNGQTPNSPQNALADIVSALSSSLPGVSAGKFGGTSPVGSSILNPSITNFLNTRNSTINSAHPSSWLNIVVLDEQLNPVLTSDGNNSYYEQVGASYTTSVQAYNLSRPITKSGYVYIYVSNETPNIYTYWDNLKVVHVKGPLLQEEGYYPFGLEMKAIGSIAALKMQTNYKYNKGIELNNNFNIDYYETFARDYDAQIGRFTSIDALTEFESELPTYQFASNNPISKNDSSGFLEDIILSPGYIHTGISQFTWDLILGDLNSNPVDFNFSNSMNQEGGGGGGGGSGNNGNKGQGKGNQYRKGGQNDRDRDMNKYPPAFRKWYHENSKDYKLPGEPDPNLEPIFKDWEDLERPNVSKAVTIWSIVGIVLYETVKWGAAAFFSPETGGASFVLAAETP